MQPIGEERVPVSAGVSLVLPQGLREAAQRVIGNAIKTRAVETYDALVRVADLDALEQALAEPLPPSPEPIEVSNSWRCDYCKRAYTMAPASPFAGCPYCGQGSSHLIEGAAFSPPPSAMTADEFANHVEPLQHAGTAHVTTRPLSTPALPPFEEPRCQVCGKPMLWSGNDGSEIDGWYCNRGHPVVVRTVIVPALPPSSETAGIRSAALPRCGVCGGPNGTVVGSTCTCQTIRSPSPSVRKALAEAWIVAEKLGTGLKSALGEYPGVSRTGTVERDIMPQLTDLVYALQDLRIAIESPSPSAPNGLREAAQELVDALHAEWLADPATATIEHVRATGRACDKVQAALAASPVYREMKWPDVELPGAGEGNP